MPSKIHGGTSCGFSFADCHAEVHKWVRPGDVETTTYITYRGGATGVVSPPDPDIIWVASHTSAPGQ
jgi:prepilin-type processing-associated H-X9-DG protein